MWREGFPRACWLTGFELPHRSMVFGQPSSIRKKSWPNSICHQVSLIMVVFNGVLCLYYSTKWRRFVSLSHTAGIVPPLVTTISGSPYLGKTLSLVKE